MVIVLFLLVAFGVGWSVLRLFPLQLSRLDYLASSAVLGIVLSSWLFFLTGWLLGYGIGVPVSLILCGLVLIGSWVWQRKGAPSIARDELVMIGWRVWVRIFLSLLVVVGAGYIVFRHSLPIQDGIWYQPGYSWSDLSLHMSLISNVAYQPSFRFTLPIYYTGSLSYPFLVDVFSGILLRMGGSWQLALFLPTVTLLLSLVQLSLSVVGKMLKSVRAAWIHLLLFLCSGSAWGLYLFIQDAHTQGVAVAAQGLDYTNIEQGEGLFFANSVTSHLLPQRGFLLGMAIALFIIFLFLQPRMKKYYGFLGVLVGLLPFIHVHTFFVLWGLMLCLLIADSIQTKRWSSSYWLPLGVALVCACPQLIWQLHTTYHQAFGSWYLGWARPADVPLGVFLLKNFGIALLFFASSFWVAKKYFSGRAVLQAILWLSWLIITVVHIRIFQPNPFDNMKFLLYGYWGISLVTAFLLARWSRYWYGALVGLICLVLLCGSGALAIVREFSVEYQEFTPQEVRFAQDVRTLIPVDAHVLTTIRHNHPLPTLTGRRILLGYTGWLWSYGIAYEGIEQDVQHIWQGGADASELLKKYDVQYVVFSDQEVYPTRINLAFFLQHSDLMYHQNGWYIFKVQR